MVELRGQIVPEDEEEFALLEDLYEVTGEAQKNGIPREEIVATLTFVAASITTFDPEEANEQEPPEPPEVSKPESCPHCGEPIEQVVWQIGGIGEVQPCGCETNAEELPGWIDDG